MKKHEAVRLGILAFDRKTTKDRLLLVALMRWLKERRGTAEAGHPFAFPSNGRQYQGLVIKGYIEVRDTWRPQVKVGGRVDLLLKRLQDVIGNNYELNDLLIEQREKFFGKR